MASWPDGAPGIFGIGIGLLGMWLGSSSAGVDAGAADVLEEIGCLEGFTPGSFMPGGGGAGAKCGAAVDEDV
ncbi:hypothetical protein GCM10007862_00810 [Dyella lipolytica]|nr:hypothetical protein GCM10007862_00810 [Dyella lipolytica]